MYLGSVRFFKHLILFVFISAIVVLGTAVAVLAGKNSAKEEEIEVLQQKNQALEAVVSFNNGGEKPGVEDFFGLMQNFDIEKDVFLQYMYEKDEESYRSVIANESDAEAGGDMDFDAESESSTESESESTTSSYTEPAETFPTIPLPTETKQTESAETAPTETEPRAAYMDMFPHLYATPDLSGSYISDDDYVYLTFDDGPSTYTSSVLDILGRYDVKATFFVIPDDNETCKAYLNKMLDSGHSIGIHSMSHDYRKIYESVEAFLADFDEAFNLVVDQTGYKPYLFRFPGGSINDYNVDTRDAIIEEMTRRGFIYYDWNVDSRDAAGATWTQMYDSVLNDIANLKRAIVLFHDGPSRQNTVYVLEDVVQALLKSRRGYTLAAIKENTRPEHH